MKRKVYPDAFWRFGTMSACEKHGTAAAEAFAKAARDGARKHRIEHSYRMKPGSSTMVPTVIAGDPAFEEWFVEESVEMLLQRYIGQCETDGGPDDLNELLAVLDRVRKRAERARSRALRRTVARHAADTLRDVESQ